jgi:hypothetical protein
MRKTVAYRNHFVPITKWGGTTLPGGSGQAEAGMVLLLYNPTLSAPLTWSANSRIETGLAAAGQTVTNVGRILDCVPLAGGASATAAPNAALRNLSVGIDNAMGELVVAYTPLTTNQSVSGYMQAVEY